MFNLRSVYRNRWISRFIDLVFVLTGGKKDSSIHWQTTLFVLSNAICPTFLFCTQKCHYSKRGFIYSWRPLLKRGICSVFSITLSHFLFLIRKLLLIIPSLRDGLRIPRANGRKFQIIFNLKIEIFSFLLFSIVFFLSYTVKL